MSSRNPGAKGSREEGIIYFPMGYNNTDSNKVSMDNGKPGAANRKIPGVGSVS